MGLFTKKNAAAMGRRGARVKNARTIDELRSTGAAYVVRGSDGYVSAPMSRPAASRFRADLRRTDKLYAKYDRRPKKPTKYTIVKA